MKNDAPKSQKGSKFLHDLKSGASLIVGAVSGRYKEAAQAAHEAGKRARAALERERRMHSSSLPHAGSVERGAPRPNPSQSKRPVSSPESPGLAVSGVITGGEFAATHAVGSGGNLGGKENAFEI